MPDEPNPMSEPLRARPPVPLSTAAELARALRETGLPHDAPAAELDELASRADHVPSILHDLVVKGRITAYQANEAALGRTAGLILGHYILLEKLGQGGMGQVFKALHRNLGRIDAVKIIREELLGNPQAVARFRREARSAARLSHPHLVTVFDAGEAQGRHFLAMEFVQGIDLDALVERDGPLDPSHAIRLLHQAALALQHVHECGLVHRDIKPSNLLLSDRGVLKLLDLGIASLHGEGAERATILTSANRILGTPDFMAPEQAADPRAVDIRADLYSLGCTAYFLLSGHVPFPGGDALEKLLRHRVEPPRPLAGQPATLNAVIERLMARTPSERFQTPRELIEALKRILHEPAPAPAIPSLEAKPAPEIGRRAFLVAGGIVALAGVIITPFACPRRDGPAKEQPAAPASWKTRKTIVCGERSVFDVLFLPDGKRVAVAGGYFDTPARGGTLSLVDISSETVTPLPHDGPSLSRLALLEGGRILAAATGGRGKDAPSIPGRITFHDLVKGSPVGDIPARVTMICAMVASDEAGWLAAAGRGGVELLHRAGGEARWLVPAERKVAKCNALALSGDGQLLACGGLDGTVRILRTAGWGVAHEFLPPTERRGYIAGLDFLQGDGELVGATGENHGKPAELCVWSLANKALEWFRPQGNHHIHCQALSPDGRTLATGSQTGEVRFWDLHTRQLIKRFPADEGNPTWSMSFSGDGRTLAVGMHDGSIRLFEGESAS